MTAPQQSTLKVLKKEYGWTLAYTRKDGVVQVETKDRDTAYVAADGTLEWESLRGGAVA